MTKPKQNKDEFLVKKKFEKKAKKLAGKIKFLQGAVELYYCAIDPKTETSVKVLAFSALANFIMPIDAIPDAIPIAGFTDDAAMISGAVATLESVVTQEHKDEAEEWLNNLY